MLQFLNRSNLLSFRPLQWKSLPPYPCTSPHPKLFPPNASLLPRSRLRRMGRAKRSEPGTSTFARLDKTNRLFLQRTSKAASHRGDDTDRASEGKSIAPLLARPLTSFSWVYRNRRLLSREHHVLWPHSRTRLCPHAEPPTYHVRAASADTPPAPHSPASTTRDRRTVGPYTHISTPYQAVPRHASPKDGLWLRACHPSGQDVAQGAPLAYRPARDQGHCGRTLVRSGLDWREAVRARRQACATCRFCLRIRSADARRVSGARSWRLAVAF